MPSKHLLSRCLLCPHQVRTALLFAHLKMSKNACSESPPRCPWLRHRSAQILCEAGDERVQASWLLCRSSVCKAHVAALHNEPSAGGVLSMGHCAVQRPYRLAGLGVAGSSAALSTATAC